MANLGDDFDPYLAAPRPVSVHRHDPFRVLSRESRPAACGRHSRPVRPQVPRAHAAPPERGLAAAGTEHDARGVFEESCPFPGLRMFAVCPGDGEPRIASVFAVEEIVDGAFIAGLERLLERYRPSPTLRAI